ncbi:hypothetical protein CARUB_v10018609mg [Capsella rubella]|uniref:Gnk2-homologous domain-containing protein n=1 Tax=Capsella rubella TaxID=81985 RepID=R0H7K4_9BRAS|nr:hypothetical protein CARUB_v10018609mg [Capsella rubella]
MLHIVGFVVNNEAEVEESLHVVDGIEHGTVRMGRRGQSSFWPDLQSREYIRENLIQVIRNISGLNLRHGYTYNSNVEAYAVSKDPNIVFVLLQCRAPLETHQSASEWTTPRRATTLSIPSLECFPTNARGSQAACISDYQLRERCPRKRGAIIWYDQWVLEISSFNTEGRILYDSCFSMTNIKNEPPRIQMKETNHTQWERQEYIGENKMYAMVQCALDLGSNGCYVCLEWIMGRYERYYFDNRQGGRVLGRSCSLRYELYPFLRR